MNNTHYKFTEEWWEMVRSWSIQTRIYYCLGFSVFWSIVMYSIVKLITY